MQLVIYALTSLRRFTLNFLFFTAWQCAFISFAESAPVRVASLNLCTDQLVLALADPEQIISVTFLSQHRPSSFLADRALGHHVNYGQVEELIGLRPDLVVSLTHTLPTTIRLLKHLEFNIELFPSADGIADVKANIKRMAKLLGQEKRGRQAIQIMSDGLNAIEILKNAAIAPRGVLYEPNGYTAGAQTLRGELIRLAGWRNIAEEVGVQGVGVIGLETLILTGPDRVILSPYAPGTHSLGQRILDHPAIGAVTSGRHPVIVPPKLWMCGGPMNVEAVARLSESR